MYAFFFQAEDGIRDKLVTGVQTCALPIWAWGRNMLGVGQEPFWWQNACTCVVLSRVGIVDRWSPCRSEERRVGKECRSRWSPDQYKRNNEGVTQVRSVAVKTQRSHTYTGA